MKASLLMVAPMVRATLADLKTQTRRVVNPQPENDPAKHHAIKPYRTPHGAWNWVLAATGHGTGDPFPCPYGVPGDRLWVRETYFAFGHWETRFSPKKGRDEWHFVDMTIETGHRYAYAADGEPATYRKRKRAGAAPDWWKRPAIFMPRVASRITLELTDVRVERLQDISEADALAEGVVPGKYAGLDRANARAYSDLWESINGAGSWDANPWVWCLSFRRL